MSVIEQNKIGIIHYTLTNKTTGDLIESSHRSSPSICPSLPSGLAAYPCISLILNPRADARNQAIGGSVPSVPVSLFVQHR